MPDTHPDELDNIAAAQYLRISPHTLNYYRYKGIGPAYYKMSRKVFYKITDLDAWKERHRHEPEAGRVSQ